MPVVQELERRGWVNKRWQTRQGRERGSRPFDRTSLHRLVINSIGGLDSVASQLGVLLGNGDGTFRAPILHSPEGGEDGDVVLGDFNKRRSVARNLPGARLLGLQTLSPQEWA